MPIRVIRGELECLYGRHTANSFDGVGESRGLSVQAESKVVGQSAQRDAANRLTRTSLSASITADDAGVYRLSADLALVQTVDFFTPIVDDPFTFGAIAAANALSDVYAMGGSPYSSLSVVAFPANGDTDVLEAILLGGLEKMREAGCAVLGGHSVADAEIKFGYAVTGLIDPARVLTNGGAKPGDRLVFTKALGTGVISTAIKKKAASSPGLTPPSPP